MKDSAFFYEETIMNASGPTGTMKIVKIRVL